MMTCALATDGANEAAAIHTRMKKAKNVFDSNANARLLAIYSLTRIAQRHIDVRSLMNTTRDARTGKQCLARSRAIRRIRVHRSVLHEQIDHVIENLRVVNRR